LTQLDWKIPPGAAMVLTIAASVLRYVRSQDYRLSAVMDIPAVSLAGTSQATGYFFFTV
jgi:hypothetical protein